jgi:hypothetical protein
VTGGGALVEAAATAHEFVLGDAFEQRLPRILINTVLMNADRNLAAAGQVRRRLDIAKIFSRRAA